MAESNSQPTRCPCGFFGSAQTLGLCSKCFREREQNRDQMTADATRSSSSVSMDIIRMDRETSTRQDDSQRNSLTPRASAETESNIRATPETEVPPRVSSSTTAVSDATVSASNLDASPHQRGRKRKADELDDATDASSDDVDGRLDPVAGAGGGGGGGADDGQPAANGQRKKSRCFACNCRINLAIREIGKCKCEGIFCALHRLPEQHNCSFDHKEHCRQEARAKMVVLRKHVGTALRRLDSDS